MPEDIKYDQFSHAENLRLECLDRAVKFVSAKPSTPTSKEIVDMARDFEQYVSEERNKKGV